MNYLDKKALNTAITGIATRIKNLDKDLHILACSALFHYQESEDTVLLTRLIKATCFYNESTGKFDGRSVRGAALRKWIKDHANVKWSKSSHGKHGGWIKDKAQDKKARVNLEHAESVPFYAYSKDEAPKEYDDVISMLSSLKDKLAKDLERTESNKEGRKIKGEQLALASTAINTLEALLKQSKPVLNIEDEQALEGMQKLQAVANQ